MTSSLIDAPFTSSAAAAHGLSEAHLTALCASGELIRPSNGLYLPVHLADDINARIGAVSLVLPPGAALARESSAWLLGVDVRPPGRWHQPPLLECLVPISTARPRRADVTAFVSDLPSDDIIDVGGVPCTSPTRTALDLARWRPRFIGLGAVDALTHAGLTTISELREAAAPLRGHRHIRRARDIIELCEPATESLPESWCRLRLIEAGLPRPEVQVSLRDEHGREVHRLDMGIREGRIGIEYDGVEHHLRTPEQRRHDDARRAGIRERFAWVVVAATKGDVLGPEPRLEDAVMELLGVSIEFRRRTWEWAV